MLRRTTPKNAVACDGGQELTFNQCRIVFAASESLISFLKNATHSAFQQ